MIDTFHHHLKLIFAIFEIAGNYKIIDVYTVNYDCSFNKRRKPKA